MPWCLYSFGLFHWPLELILRAGCTLNPDLGQVWGFIDIKSPRSAIKKGFEIDLITDGEGWLKLLEDSNLTAHAYDEVMAKEIEKLIRKKYFPLIKELFDILHQK